MLWFFRSKEKRLMRNTILGKSRLKLGDTYYPLKSTVHISHIAQHAVAGERHAFRVSSLQFAVSSCKLPVISSAAERSREILSCRSIAKRKNPTQITQIFTEFPVRRQIMLASERIARNRTERKRKQSRYNLRDGSL